MAKDNNDYQRLPLLKKDIHKEFKLTCLHKGISMREACEEAIQDWLKKPEKSEQEQK